jgi:preprotein translocase subunit SecE
VAKKKATPKQKSPKREISRRSPSKKTTARKQPNAITRFYRETVGELRKVSWPSWNEARRLTFIVVVTVAAMAVFLGIIMDFLFTRLFGLILGS